MVAANESFQDGSVAFKRGDTDKALRIFLALETQSKELSPQLTLNIALIYLRTKQYELASEHFSRLAHKPKWDMLAEYYLGLAAHLNGDAEQANKHLLRVATQADNVALKERAKFSLSQLQNNSSRTSSSSTKAAVQQAKNVSYYLSYGSGYENNAVGLPSDQLGSELQSGDAFNELLIQGSYPVIADMEVSAYLSSRIYDEYSDLNTSILNLGLEYEFSLLGDRRTSIFDFSEVWVDGTAMYSQWQAQLSSPITVLTNQLDASLSVQQKLAENEFQYLDGYQFKLELNKAWPLNNHTLELDYAYEINNREDLTDSDEFSSYSPRHHRLAISDEFRFSEKIEFNASLRAVSSQWRGTNLIKDEEDNLNSVKRKGDTYQYALAALYHVSSNMEVSISVEYFDNDENIDTNSYENSQLMLMLVYEN